MRSPTRACRRAPERVLAMVACVLGGFMGFPASAGSAAIDPATLPAVSYHPGGIAYWSAPVFANALYQGGRWIEYADGEWGETVPHHASPQFNDDGYPRYLNPGRKLRALCYGLHCDYGNRPSTWPRRSGPATGRVTLTWKGNADIRLHGGELVRDDSSAPPTGAAVDGRRVYVYRGDAHLEWLEVHEIDPGRPIEEIRAWLPDPADPENRSLEGRLFHPTYLARLRDESWGFLRTMDLQSTNANPQQDWSDRRRPSHVFMNGVLNPRTPAPGVVWWHDDQGNPHGPAGHRGTGIAFEQMIQLCNAAGLDLWVNVPHLATDEFARNLARLIRFGSDGDQPYDHPVAEPVYPPLAAGRRVFVEYSNEIWSSGDAFPQGDWAGHRAGELGISKAEFNGRRFCEVWRIFDEVFDTQEDRLTRVAAVFTALESYTRPFLEEIRDHGPGLDPPVEPDVIAVTTYFGNGIQDWALKTAVARAGSDDAWFVTPDRFDAGGGEMRPVSRPATDPYWTGEAIDRHLRETFEEWTRRLLSGDAREGDGPDAVGVGGGFPPWVRDLARTTFPAPKPIVAYEGGPSIYTDRMDGGDPRDDGVTTFMEELNRRPGMREVYAAHLNMARAKGLWTHVLFTGCGVWGKYGQWGHLEHIDQDPDLAVKYRFARDWIDEMRSVRHPDHPEGAVPSFTTAHRLPPAIVGRPYDAIIATTGGDGDRSVSRIADCLPPGLGTAPVDGASDQLRIAGTPSAGGVGYLYLRVTDGDGDPAWRTFTARAVGGPGVVIETDFTGADPALHLPWTTAFYTINGVTSPGWTRGPGITPREGNNALLWSVAMPAEEEDASLALALADGEWWSLTVNPPVDGGLDLRGAEIRFTIRRLDYHAPRRYALFTAIGGFDPGDEVFASPRSASEGDLEFVVRLPDTMAYERIGEPIELRLCGYAGQYGGHRTSLREFRLGGGVVAPPAPDDELHAY